MRSASDTNGTVKGQWGGLYNCRLRVYGGKGDPPEDEDSGRTDAFSISPPLLGSRNNLDLVAGFFILCAAGPLPARSLRRIPFGGHVQDDLG